MKLSDFSNHILFNGDKDSKLINVENIEFDDILLTSIPKLPSRNDQLKFSTKNAKFPKGNLFEIEKKAMALHSFANHELLAVEMMACALAIYPHHTDELKKFKRGVISSLQDEQKHFRLYEKRLNDLGYEFGDFEINDFFWKQMKSLKTPTHYLATMALTFEAANLDFAFYFENLFRQMEDFETADVLEIVLKEEISHVGFGVHYLQKWREDKSLWDYYIDHLPFPITPARSKGKIFRKEERLKAKMPEEFISKIQKYQDDFKITQRREWKK